jgi:hypothetical protein
MRADSDATVVPASDSSFVGRSVLFCSDRRAAATATAAQQQPRGSSDPSSRLVAPLRRSLLPVFSSCLASSRLFRSNFKTEQLGFTVTYVSAVVVVVVVVSFFLSALL